MHSLNYSSYGLPLGYDSNGVTAYARESMIVNRTLTEAEALAHSGWLALTGNDRNLLAKTVENAFRLGKDKYGYDTMMGFYVPTNTKPILLAAVLNGLYGGSDVGGSLNDENARLVGGSPSFIVGEGANGTEMSQPEAGSGISAPKNLLEQVLMEHKMTHPSELRKVLELYRAAAKILI